MVIVVLIQQEHYYLNKMTRTFKDKNNARYRKRKSAIYSKYLFMWADDFPCRKSKKDRTLSKQVRRRKKIEDKLIIKEYLN